MTHQSNDRTGSPGPGPSDHPAQEEATHYGPAAPANGPATTSPGANSPDPAAPVDPEATDMSASRSQPAADRNLLFGVLALQMDFINRDALVRAMNAWFLDKARPLGQILVEPRALRAAAHLLLETLVAKHLEMHGGDPQKSLASLSSFGSILEELRKISDTDLYASLDSVPVTRCPDQDAYATRGDNSPSAATDPFGTRAPAVDPATLRWADGCPSLRADPASGAARRTP